MKRAAFVAGSFALVAAFAAGIGTARADDLSDLQGMLGETVVTTASKSAETGTSAPATSTILTAEDMRRYGMHSLDEAINFLAMGVITADPLHAVDVGARGVMLPLDQGDHFLLLVNGHAENDPLFGAARLNRGLGIPLEMIDHVEVILGPGSVLYGSNAMLGVINVITKRAKDWHGTHLVGEAVGSPSDQVGGGSSFVPTWYRGAAGVGYEFKLFGAPSEMTLGLEYQTQNGPAFTFGPQRGGIDPVSGAPYRFTHNGPATGIWGGVASDTYNSQVPGGQLRVISGNFELNVHASTYHRTTPYRARFSLPYNDFDIPGYELERSLWGDLRYHATLSPIFQLTARLYADSWDYQDVADTSQVDVCRYPPATSCSLHYTGVTRWGGVELQPSFDWLKDATFVTLLGVDARTRLERAKTDVDNFDQPGGNPQHLVSSTGIIRGQDLAVGLYGQQTWQPARWLGFNGGARFDYEDRFQGQISPRLAANATLWRGGTLKAIYAEAYRAPTWMETNFYNPNQIVADALNPERVRSVEGSVSQVFGAQRLFFGAFRSWWSDMVELHFLTPAETAAAAAAGKINEFNGSEFAQYRNVSSIDNYGFNAGYSGGTGNGSLRYGVNVTGAYARRFDPGQAAQPLTVTPELFGNARLSYDIPGLWPTLAMAGQFQAKRPADLALTGAFTSVPYAPAQLELRWTISGDFPKVPGLSYRLMADYAFGPRAPYVVGPNTLSTPIPAELAPVNQFQAGVGLQYDLFR